MQLNFDDGVDSVLCVNYHLNVHSDGFERVFSVAIRSIVDSVQLQYFQGQNHVTVYSLIML